MKYYSLYPEDDDKQGVAYAPENITFELLYRKGVVADWRPIEFTLKGGEFTDYQWNNLGWHMCSEKLRNILVGFAGPDDLIQWLPVMVRDVAGEKRPYDVLHLPKPLDVLSRSRTIISGEDLIVKPMLDASRIGSHHIFTYSHDTGRVYLSEAVRKRIRAAKVTGLDFLKVPVVPTE